MYNFKDLIKDEYKNSQGEIISGVTQFRRTINVSNRTFNSPIDTVIPNDIIVDVLGKINEVLGSTENGRTQSGSGEFQRFGWNVELTKNGQFIAISDPYFRLKNLDQQIKFREE